MIQLYQFAPAFGLPNASPFCMKLETYLRMTGLPFEIPRFKRQQLMHAPKGKLPYIVHGDQRVADSGLIIDDLKAKYGDPLDGWMNAAQCAVALAWQRLIEEHLYEALLSTRWIEPEG